MLWALFLALVLPSIAEKRSDTHPLFSFHPPVPVKIYYTTTWRGGSVVSGTNHEAGDTDSDPSHEGEGGVLLTDRPQGPPPLHGYLINLNEEIKRWRKKEPITLLHKSSALYIVDFSRLSLLLLRWSMRTVYDYLQPLLIYLQDMVVLCVSIARLH